MYLRLDESQAVVRFDGTTGARIRTYDMRPFGGFGTLEVLGRDRALTRLAEQRLILLPSTGRTASPL